MCYNVNGDDMRLRNIKDKEKLINNSEYIVNNPKENINKWNKIFNNNNPIHIEIGMGKGKFILENAIKYPNINFIGIEKYDSALARAIKKISNYNIPNLKLMRLDAKELNLVFNKEISLIYLNFSDPWPKDRHEKRRLTYKDYICMYDGLFKNGKRIILKTDNRGLFEYSLTSLSNCNYIIKKINLDLHNSSECDIITTEYEDKFVDNGKIIYKVECEKK